MTFKPAIWFPIAVVLSAVNVAAAWFAAQPGEAWHATVHAGLGVAFGLWAQRLRRGASHPVMRILAVGIAAVGSSPMWLGVALAVLLHDFVVLGFFFFPLFGR